MRKKWYPNWNQNLLLDRVVLVEDCVLDYVLEHVLIHALDVLLPALMDALLVLEVAELDVLDVLMGAMGVAEQDVKMDADPDALQAAEQTVVELVEIHVLDHVQLLVVDLV